MNVVFDFGKVLVDYDFDILLKDLFEDPADRALFLSEVGNQDFIDACDKGDMTFENLVDQLKEKYPQWAWQFQQYHDRQLEVITGEVPGMRGLIMRLKGAGYKIYGLTNWSSAVYDVIEKFDILQLVDYRLISSEEKLIKPTREIYDRFCAKFGLKAEECVFTDDREVNVEGARAAGMKAILFKNAADYERQLSQYIEVPQQ